MFLSKVYQSFSTKNIKILFTYYTVIRDIWKSVPMLYNLRTGGTS